MVLRIVSIFILSLFLASPSYAQKMSKRDKLEFRKARLAAKKGNHRKSLAILKNSFNLKRGPIPVIKLAAKSTTALNLHKAAMSLYSQLIVRTDIKGHKEVVLSYKKHSGTDEIDEIPEELLPYYWAMAKTYLAITRSKKYANNHSFLKKSLNRAKMYLDFCIEGEYKDEQAEKILATFEDEKAEKERVIYSSSLYATFGYISWQDEIQLEGPTGQEDILQGTTEGQCLGMGYKNENYYYGYKIEGCLAIAKSTVGADTTNVNYFQKDVTVFAFQGTPSVYFRPASGSTILGAGLALFARKGDYTTPTDPGFQINNGTFITFGPFVEFGWEWEKLAMNTKMGKLLKLPSAFWSLLFHWNF